MSTTAAETKHPSDQNDPVSMGTAQDAAEPQPKSAHILNSPQHQLPTVLWEKILLALEPTEQDKLRFSCKKFYRALQPYIVFVQTSQGETKKSGRGNRTVKTRHIVSSLSEALAVLGSFRVEYPLRRFEIRLARGSHMVDDDYEWEEWLRELWWRQREAASQRRDRCISSGCFNGLHYCRGVNLCVRTSQIYALCGKEGVEFAKLIVLLQPPNVHWHVPLEAFAWCSTLTSVTFPEGLQQVGEGAFAWCSSLTSVTFPPGCQQVGEGAFFGCSSLTSVTFPEGLQQVGNYAFCGCSSLTSVTFLEGLQNVGSSAFEGCIMLTSVTFPHGLQKVGDEVFAGCISLSFVTFPSWFEIPKDVKSPH